MKHPNKRVEEIHRERDRVDRRFKMAVRCIVIAFFGIIGGWALIEGAWITSLCFLTLGGLMLAGLRWFDRATEWDSTRRSSRHR